MSEAVDAYMVYMFVRRLSQPFKETDAFRLGLIDEKGKLLKSPKTIEEKKAYTLYDRLIFNIKRIFEKFNLSSKTATFTAALFLLKEANNIPIEEVDDERYVYNLLKEELYEDAPANAVGSGNIAGANQDPPGKKNTRFLRRFANSDVFLVSPDVYAKARLGKKKYTKYESYVGNDEVGQAIREYGRKYPDRPIILQNDSDSSMMYLKYGKRLANV